MARSYYGYSNPWLLLLVQELHPGLERPDMVYPTLILEQMPVGLVGLLIAVMIVVSYLTPKPNYDAIKPYIWTREIFREDSRELRGTPWWGNYRYWSMLLLVSCIALLYIFR